MTSPLRTLVIGCGHMGASHARAYATNPGFNLVGVVSRGAASRDALAQELSTTAYSDAFAAIAACKPEVVCIASYTETHAAYTLAALEAGAHVFVEKPLAGTMAEAEAVIAAARQHGRALMVGYILRQHPSWQRFITIARDLGKPLVMRMNLNQQSSGSEWKTHQQLIADTPPIVDCGVHYVDVMCQMTGSRPVSVYALMARLSDEIPADRFNYGMLQVRFADGSIGWYEAGWGPMMSEEAHFVKDVVGPRGSATIVAREASSDSVENHTRTACIRVHHADRDANGAFTRSDDLVDTGDEPDHQGLCDREQQALLDAIHGSVSLEDHWRAALDSLRIVFAAQESAETGTVINLVQKPGLV
jgi:predicted dehydrogenase